VLLACILDTKARFLGFSAVLGMRVEMVFAGVRETLSKRCVGGRGREAWAQQPAVRRPWKCRVGLRESVCGVDTCKTSGEPISYGACVRVVPTLLLRCLGHGRRGLQQKERKHEPKERCSSLLQRNAGEREKKHRRKQQEAKAVADDDAVAYDHRVHPYIDRSEESPAAEKMPRWTWRRLVVGILWLVRNAASTRPKLFASVRFKPSHSSEQICSSISEFSALMPVSVAAPSNILLLSGLVRNGPELGESNGKSRSRWKDESLQDSGSPEMRW
jgi:hypothetical protein